MITGFWAFLFPRNVSSLAPVDEKPAIFAEHHHDPKEYRLGPHSKPWVAEHYCRFCGETIGHNERMMSICLSCGTHGSCGVNTSERSARTLYVHGKKTEQFVYPNNETVLGSRLPPKKYRFKK